MNLEAVAAELYRVKPDAFTAARNAQAKQLTAEGDRALAARVRALPRPPASAWALNGLAREHAEIVGQVAELGLTLRGEQQHPDRQRLGELNEQRRALVNRATAVATEYAAQNGVHLSDSATAEVQQSLFAAIADAAAAAAVFSGRLVRPVQSIGLDDVDLDGAMAGAAPVPAQPAPARSAADADEGAPAAAGAAGRPDAETAASATRARRRAQAEAREAEAVAVARQAADTAASADEALRAHDDEADDVSAQLEETHARLIRLEHRQAQLASRRNALERERQSTNAAAQRARDEARAAHNHVRALD